MIEIVTSIIVAVASIVVAFIQSRRDASKEKKNKATIIKDNEKLLSLKDNKKANYDDREQAYNKLTMSIAKHIILKETSTTHIEQAMKECHEADEKYETATRKYLDGLTKLIEDEP